MFERFVKAITPFALTLIIIAGASLASWIQFSNKYAVGVLVVFFGILLTVSYIVGEIRQPKQGK